MGPLPWYVTALGAALVWGVHYPLLDHALKRVSLVSLLLLNALPMLLLAPVFWRTLAADCHILSSLDWDRRILLLTPALTNLLACVLLFLSIGSKNATLASLIEISYPVFVALFAYLLFREIHIDPKVALGGLLVFAGVVLIILNSP
ncbi:MAG: EamA family transporter [Gammaproteobacteria bacterium]|nr:EamA family transporter [Gammaproteobacteria bacterium]MCP5459326.1 EamA family transporter [Gammaproteobacteria bacterium]